MILLTWSSDTGKPHHGFESWKSGCHSAWELEGTDWERTCENLSCVSVCGEERSAHVGRSSATCALQISTWPVDYIYVITNKKQEKIEKIKRKIRNKGVTVYCSAIQLKYICENNIYVIWVLLVATQGGANSSGCEYAKVYSRVVID